MLFTLKTGGEDVTSEQDMISSFEIIRRIAGDKWKFLIITYLFNGSKRFGELQYHIDLITKKVLTENLRELEHFGIICRKEYTGIIPKVEYSLTDIGTSLQPVFESLIIWSLSYSNLFKEKLEQIDKSKNNGGTS